MCRYLVDTCDTYLLLPNLNTTRGGGHKIVQNMSSNRKLRTPAYQLSQTCLNRQKWIKTKLKSWLSGSAVLMMVFLSLSLELGRVERVLRCSLCALPQPPPPPSSVALLSYFSSRSLRGPRLSTPLRRSLVSHSDITLIRRLFSPCNARRENGGSQFCVSEGHGRRPLVLSRPV